MDHERGRLSESSIVADQGYQILVNLTSQTTYLAYKHKELALPESSLCFAGETAPNDAVHEWL